MQSRAQPETTQDGRAWTSSSLLVFVLLHSFPSSSTIRLCCHPSPTTVCALCVCEDAARLSSNLTLAPFTTSLFVMSFFPRASSAISQGPPAFFAPPTPIGRRLNFGFLLSCCCLQAFGTCQVAQLLCWERCSKQRRRCVRPQRCWTSTSSAALSHATFVYRLHRVDERYHGHACASRGAEAEEDEQD